MKVDEDINYSQSREKEEETPKFVDRNFSTSSDIIYLSWNESKIQSVKDYFQELIGGQLFYCWRSSAISSYDVLFKQGDTEIEIGRYCEFESFNHMCRKSKSHHRWHCVIVAFRWSVVDKSRWRLKKTHLIHFMENIIINIINKQSSIIFRVVFRDHICPCAHLGIFLQ